MSSERGDGRRAKTSKRRKSVILWDEDELDDPTGVLAAPKSPRKTQSRTRKKGRPKKTPPGHPAGARP